MSAGIAQIGDVLAGKYRVDKILGVGGMGMVVAATHLELDQKVALKFMLPAALESNEASKRFLREARAAGSLKSEHICRVIDLGRLENGAPYIVMEYMEGYDLQSLMKKRGALKLSDAVDYILQACEGMAEAHRQGIVHRDLKPGNLFITRRADSTALVKVLDFGISKAASGAIATRTGDVMGSPAYMAPEQMESTKDVDPRADIWSLGVILYQLVTGRTPFHADTLPALCLRVINDPPPPLDSLRADLPDGFSDAVMRCLEKNREDRYLDVGELAEALAPYGGDESSLAVTRIEGVLHPGPPVRLSYVNTDVEPTLTASSDGLLPARPSDLPTQPPPRSHGTFTIGAGESMHHVGSRLLSAGWLGALIAAAGLAVLVLVIVLKSGNGNSAADPQVEPAAGSAPAPQVTVTPLDPPPAKWTDIANDAGAGSAAQTPPIPEVPPPDPPVAHDDQDRDKKPPKKVGVRAPRDTGRSKDRQKDQDKKDHPKDTTSASKGSGDDDAVWEHMTHDKAPAKPPEKAPEKAPDKPPETTP